MPWPLSQDYNEAIQSAAVCFADADLKRGQVVCNALGLPIPYSGNFADVYQVKCPDGSRWAVKCFTREAAGLRERYQEISKHLRQVKLPFTVDFTYLEQGIRVLGRWYPVLKMEWVEGQTLNQFVSQNLDKPATLEALLHLWAKMARYLRAAGVGHCDLQHGNVLLVPAANSNLLLLKLIDYDGMWVPGLAGKKPGEVGHPSYQHPQRIVEGTYSLEVDRFPLLLVATALRALKARGLELWDKYDNGDNILFTETDLREPKQSVLIKELLHLGDPETTTLLVPFLKSLYYGLASAPLLEEVLTEARPVSPPKSDPRLPRASVPAAPIQAVSSESNTWTFGQFASAPSMPSVSRPQLIKAKMIGVPVWAWAAAITLLLVSLGTAGSVVLWMLSGNSITPQPGNRITQSNSELKTVPPKDNKPPPKDDLSGDPHMQGPPNRPPTDLVEGNRPKERDKWESLNIGTAQTMGNVLQIWSQSSITTKEEFTGPIEVTLLACTAKNSIRLRAFNGAGVIFNWEGNPKELRVHRPDGNDMRESGTIASTQVQPLDPHVFYALRWRITQEGMEVFVDNTLVFSERRTNELSAKRPVTVASVDSVIQLKSFDVTRLSALVKNPPPTTDKADPLKLGAGLNKENFDKIAKGMTLNDVTALLGLPPGARAGNAWSWPGPNGSSIAVVLTQDKVVSKTNLQNWPVVYPSDGVKPSADDAWVQKVAALAADKQIEAVVAELKARNPGFDGKVTTTVENGVVVGLTFDSDAVTDIAPARALAGLRYLTCGTYALKRGRLADLSPLKGLPLTRLFFFNMAVSDLSPLKDMKLMQLNCQNTMVSDLSPLKGMPLTTLACSNTEVSDLSPLKDMPLKELRCDFKPERDAEILRSIPTLERINMRSAKDFWNEVKAKQTDKKPEANEQKAIKTPSGLQYEELKVGDGAVVKKGDNVTVHFTGWLKDGAKFDSSLDRMLPFSFQVGKPRGPEAGTAGPGALIRCWDEAVTGMKEGGKRKLAIPPQLGLGNSSTTINGVLVIPPNAELQLEVELLKVK